MAKPNYCEPITNEPPDPLSHSYEDECVCPYCGDEMTDSWELGSGGEESGETNCGNCNRPFYYERHISVSYSTTPIIGPHPEDT